MKTAALNSTLPESERRAIRREIARIFSPVESLLLESINDVRGARGLPAFESLAHVRESECDSLN